MIEKIIDMKMFSGTVRPTGNKCALGHELYEVNRTGTWRETPCPECATKEQELKDRNLNATVTEKVIEREPHVLTQINEAKEFFDMQKKARYKPEGVVGDYSK